MRLESIFSRARFALACSLLTCLPLSPALAIARVSCEELAQLQLTNVVSIAAQEMPAGRFIESTPSWNSPEGVLPTFCRVTVIVRPQITIEVWLPKDRWNQRFRGEGGHSYGGYINYSGMADALRAGYATASTDMGHQYPAERAPYVGAFGLNPDGSLNKQLIEDFGWRSVHELALEAKAVIRAYFGEPPRYSYWRGWSTGGRQGLTAVQRFPEEYDGVLAGAPGINWDKYVLAAGLWQYIVVQQEVGYPIQAAKVATLKQAVLAACDRQDGVADGLISDPRECHFDPGVLTCKGHKDNSTCLTEQETNAIRKIWKGPTRPATGERLWFGIERGADLWTTSFPDAISGIVEYVRWTKRDPTFDWRTLKEEDFESLIWESSTNFEDTLGTDQPDLQRFRARGGKLLIWHGETDEGIPPRGIVHYYERVLAANGGAAQVDSFMRLFLLPGIGHGTGDAPFPGSPTRPDPLFDALVNWVEKGIPPDHVVASQKLLAGALRTRPLCAYPKVARWKGKGSTDEASNFACVDRARDPDDFRVVSW